VGSIDRRIQDLERLIPASDPERGRRVRERFAESLEESSERSLSHARAHLDAGDTRLPGPGDAPITAAAFYAVLASRGDPLAEEARALYAEISERRRRHPAAVELEERAAGITEASRRQFAELVERHARPPGS
jgi:hypothetical protein